VAVQATHANIGWSVVVDTTGSEVFTAEAPNSPSLDLRLEVNRGKSTTGGFGLRVYSVPYLVTDSSQSSTSQLVHEEDISAPADDSFVTRIGFTLSDVTQDVLLSLVIVDEVAASRGDTFEEEGAVLAQQDDGSWIVVPIAQYDHEVNIVIRQELEALIPDGIPDVDMPAQDPIVPSDEEIREPEPKDPDGPFPMSTTTTAGNGGETDVPGGTEGPGGTDGPGGDGPGGTDGSGSGNEGGSGCDWCYKCTVGEDSKTCTPCSGVAKPHVTKPFNAHGSYQVSTGSGASVEEVQVHDYYHLHNARPCSTTLVTRPACACKTAIAEVEGRHVDTGLEARQNLEFPASVTVQVTAPNRHEEQTPVRRYVAILAGDVYENGEAVGYRVAGKLTDNAGQAVFDFKLSAGQEIVANQFWVFMATRYVIVGTRANRPDNLMAKLIPLSLDATEFTVRAGDSISRAVSFPVSGYNRAFEVADVLTTTADVFRTEIVRKDEQAEQIYLWFPGQAKPGGFVGLGDKPIFINIAERYWRSPAVIAHEYGHWVHFLARRRAELEAYDAHDWCGDGSNKTERLAFSEGFASAFAMYALDQSRHVDATAEYMTWRENPQEPADTSAGRDINLEAFDCRSFDLAFDERFLSNQEGRVGAALFDLVDRKLDRFDTVSTNFGRVGAVFDAGLLNWRWKPRYLFWDLIEQNPQSIVAYW
jgi:hypothetical protein